MGSKTSKAATTDAERGHVAHCRSKAAQVLRFYDGVAFRSNDSTRVVGLFMTFAWDCAEPLDAPELAELRKRHAESAGSELSLRRMELGCPIPGDHERADALVAEFKPQVIAATAPHLTWWSRFARAHCGRF